MPKPCSVEISLRRASGDDEAFLHALYADRRRPELAALQWSPTETQAFIDMQFRAQQAGYGTGFPDADHRIVTADDHRVGRLLVDRRADEHLVVDVVILTRWRGRGIGTALMDDMLRDARAAGRPVRLSAAAHDERLVAWYRRLGFAVAGPAGLRGLNAVAGLRGLNAVAGPNVAMVYEPLQRAE